MRHYKKGRKLGTDTSHTKAMKKSLVNSLLLNDRIKTIESRAKEIRPDVDKIITWAKKGDLHSRRLAIAATGDKELVREMFEKVEQGMFSGRNGGYTRILKLGPRKGDGAPMVIMELVTEPVAKKAPKAAPKKATPRRVAAAPKAEETPEVTEEEVEALVDQPTSGDSIEAAAETEKWEEAAAADQVEAVTEEGYKVREGVKEVAEERQEDDAEVKKDE